LGKLKIDFSSNPAAFQKNVGWGGEEKKNNKELGTKCEGALLNNTVLIFLDAWLLEGVRGKGVGQEGGKE